MGPVDDGNTPKPRSGYVVDDSGTAVAAETTFNRQRILVGLIAGPALFFIIRFWPGATLATPALSLAAIMALMIVFWMTEALPLAVTAMLGPTLAVLLGVAPARTAFAPFADPIIFLFIGSFILAAAMFVHGLDRRIAYSALASRWVGASAWRLGFTYAAVTAGISMWMSNTATTAMMFPLALAVLAELRRDRQDDPAFRDYALALMLITSFAASIGGIGTPVGTPPNLIGVGLLRDLGGVRISFTSWMLIGVPIVFLTMSVLVVTLLLPRARHVTLGTAAVATVRKALEELGPIGRGERNVILAFGVTILLWVAPGLLQAFFGGTHPLVQRLNVLVPEAVAAMVGAILLFLLPVDWRARKFTLSWEHASRIDWGIVLLFGGGLAMGQMADASGLSKALGQWMASQFPGAGTVGLTLLFTAAGVVLSEAASNTAAANIVVPIAIAVSKAAGVPVLEPALGATLGASMGFMLPVSTPPNAIVYSSGYIPITSMMRHGVLLDVIGYAIIVVVVLALGRFVG
jgi:solute carrier family 13 (sodium-dependent dicarboxylate transporter), member 2/3/5